MEKTLEKKLNVLLFMIMDIGSRAILASQVLRVWSRRRGCIGKATVLIAGQKFTKSTWKLIGPYIPRGQQIENVRVASLLIIGIGEKTNFSLNNFNFKLTLVLPSSNTSYLSTLLSELSDTLKWITCHRDLFKRVWLPRSGSSVGLSVVPCTKGLQIWFTVRAHT